MTDATGERAVPKDGGSAERARAALDGLGALGAVEPSLERAAGQSLNNELWRVSAGGRSWALRIGQDDDTLGQNRAHEATAAAAAARAGAAPALLAERDGVQLLDWVDGRTWGPDDVDKGGALRLAALLRKAHVPAPFGLPTLADRVESMLSRAVARGARVPEGLEDALRRVRAADRPNPVLTHHDVWSNNVLDDGSRLWLVDWEFAGAGDGAYDLASVAIAAGLDEEGERELLAAYGAPYDAGRLAEARWSVAVFEGAWALAMHTARGSDAFDYASHARTMFAAIAAS